MSEADIYNLEFLSLVAKITQELLNHTGLNDKTLAEFVIALHDESKSIAEFKQKLKHVGANFPDSFVENMDRLILNMHPKHKKKSVSATQNGDGEGDGVVDELDKKRRMFPGLAMKDQDWQPSVPKDVLMKEVDDMMAQFEGAAKKTRTRPAENGSDRSPKRQRRSRSRSPQRREPSPPRRDWRDEPRGRNGRGRATLDERPVLFKIYNGRVSGLKEFGAFVQLEGVAGRVEGTQTIYCFVASMRLST